MRILEISSASSIGGGERHMTDLSNELARRGHEVFAAVRPGSPLPGKLPALPATNIATFPLKNALDVRSARNVAKFVGENKIELINAHLARDYTMAAFAATRNRVPLVLTRHVLFPMNRLHRLFLRQVAAVIAPSNAVAENLRSEGIFPAEKIVTIRYGMNVDSFPARSPVEREGFCVGSIGNLDPVKGFDVLIRAAQIVSKENPNVKFRIVGEDRSRDGRNQRELRDLIARLDLTDTVELVGWSDDIAGVLAGFDVFVSASRSESFGFVIAEAMLSGVPVIATRTEGAKEIISDPTLGRLIPIDSPEDLASSILALSDDRTRREELAGAGRKHVETHFSMNRMVDETEALFKQLT